MGLFGGDAGARPVAAERLQHAQAHARLLHHLAPGAIGGVLAAIQQARGRLGERRLVGQSDRRAQLAHQQRHPPIGIVGQYASGLAVILDEALDGRPVLQPEPREAEPAPALVQGLDRQDLDGAVYGAASISDASSSEPGS